MELLSIKTQFVNHDFYTNFFRLNSTEQEILTANKYIMKPVMIIQKSSSQLDMRFILQDKFHAQLSMKKSSITLRPGGKKENVQTAPPPPPPPPPPSNSSADSRQSTDSY